MRRELVLPVRIELTTSALPRMRSTTELRQHVVRNGAPMTGRAFACQPVAAADLNGHVLVTMNKDREREERLAAALRENLRRRKAQSRKLSSPEPKGGDEE